MQERQAEFTDASGRPCILGEVDFNNAKEFRRWLQSLNQTPLHIDMSGVTFFDSSAPQMLLVRLSKTTRCASST
jgi:anti-anti-sigma factor